MGLSTGKTVPEPHSLAGSTEHRVSWAGALGNGEAAQAVPSEEQGGLPHPSV